jgi:hypothetical protein
VIAVDAGAVGSAITADVVMEVVAPPYNVGLIYEAENFGRDGMVEVGGVRRGRHAEHSDVWILVVLRRGCEC